METSELKEQILYAHNLCNPFSACDVRNVLRALLADIEREDVPKPTGYKNRVQVCPECNIDMYQDLSTKNAGLWVWYCPECGQEIKIT